MGSTPSSGQQPEPVPDKAWGPLPIYAHPQWSSLNEKLVAFSTFDANLQALLREVAGLLRSAETMASSMATLADELAKWTEVSGDPQILRCGRGLQATTADIMRGSGNATASDSQSQVKCALTQLRVDMQHGIVEPLERQLAKHRKLFVDRDNPQEETDNTEDLWAYNRVADRATQSLLEAYEREKTSIIQAATEHLRSAMYAFFAIAACALTAILPEQAEFRPLSEMRPGQLEFEVEVLLLESQADAGADNVPSWLGKNTLQRVSEKLSGDPAMLSNPLTADGENREAALTDLVKKHHNDVQKLLYELTMPEQSRTDDATLLLDSEEGASYASRFPTSLNRVRQHKSKAAGLLKDRFEKARCDLKSKDPQRCSSNVQHKKHPFDGAWMCRNQTIRIEKSLPVDIKPHKSPWLQLHPNGVCVRKDLKDGDSIGLLTFHSQAIIWQSPDGKTIAGCWTRQTSDARSSEEGSAKRPIRCSLLNCMKAKPVENSVEEVHRKKAYESWRTADDEGNVVLKSMVQDFLSWDDMVHNTYNKGCEFMEGVKQLTSSMIQLGEALENCASDNPVSSPGGAQAKSRTSKSKSSSASPNVDARSYTPKDQAAVGALVSAIRAIACLQDPYTVVVKLKKDIEFNVLHPLHEHMENNKRLQDCMRQRKKAYVTMRQKAQSLNAGKKSPEDAQECFTKDFAAAREEFVAIDQRVFEWLWALEVYRNDTIDSIVETMKAMQAEFFVASARNMAHDLTTGDVRSGVSAHIEFPFYWSIEKRAHEVDSCEEWSQMQDQDFLRNALQELLDSTWSDRLTRDRRDSWGSGSVPHFKVVSVERNQNLPLWRQYFWKREQLRLIAKVTGGYPTLTASTTKFLKKSSSSPGAKFLKNSSSSPCGTLVDAACLCKKANECLLFHGCPVPSAQAILKEGFRLSYTGQHRGTMYGHAFYFAEASSKADEYADVDPGSSLHAMLLCRVACGSVLKDTRPRPDVQALLDNIKGLRTYNSVLGDRTQTRGTYREFVVYEEDQVYPEYLIYYSRREGAPSST